MNGKRDNDTLTHARFLPCLLSIMSRDIRMGISFYIPIT